MAMATTTLSWLSILFCVVLLCHGSVAHLFSTSVNPLQNPRQRGSKECRFDSIHVFEPLAKVRSEAGFTEYFDENNKHFQCAGVSASLRVVLAQGLSLPQFNNAQGLAFVIQGSGYVGLSFPGCPAIDQQQFDGSQGHQGQNFTDEHQKIHQFRKGDVVALPAGVVHWFYNNGGAPVIAIFVFYLNNNANQLEPTQKEFLLAGKSEREQQLSEHQSTVQVGQNIFSGFNVELLSEALGLSVEEATSLESLNDQRGQIVQVNLGLSQLLPTGTTKKQDKHQYQHAQYREGPSNGLEENLCAIEARINIEDPNHADTYNPQSGTITRLNSHKFPILNLVQMSATRVNLYQNAVLSPFWNINSHSLVYVIQGHARMQVVNNQGRTMFSGYIISSAYRISREEAHAPKNSRGEHTSEFTP